MSRIAFLSLFIVILFSLSCSLYPGSSANSVAGGSEKDGFRGMKWGTPLQEMESELTFVGRDEGKELEWYRKGNDDLSLGGAALESIHYVFYQGMFKKVAMVARGPDNYRLLRQHFVASFGETTESTDRSSTWKLDKSIVMFAYNPASEVSLLILQEN